MTSGENIKSVSNSHCKYEIIMEQNRIGKTLMLGVFVLSMMVVLLLSSCRNRVETPFDEGKGYAYVAINTAYDTDLVNWASNNQAVLEELGWKILDGSKLGFRIQLLDFKPIKANKNTDSLSLRNNLNDKEVVVIKQNDIYVLDIESFLANMDVATCCTGVLRSNPDGSSTGENQDKTPEGDGVPRCVDYNGPLGNGKNDEKGIQKYINFIGSDCSMAAMKGLCWDEHGNKNGKGGCYNTHGGKLCTELINK